MSKLGLSDYGAKTFQGSSKLRKHMIPRMCSISGSLSSLQKVNGGFWRTSCMQSPKLSFQIIYQRVFVLGLAFFVIYLYFLKKKREPFTFHDAWFHKNDEILSHRDGLSLVYNHLHFLLVKAILWTSILGMGDMIGYFCSLIITMLLHSVSFVPTIGKSIRLTQYKRYHNQDAPHTPTIIGPAEERHRYEVSIIRY